MFRNEKQRLLKNNSGNSYSAVLSSSLKPPRVMYNFSINASADPNQSEVKENELEHTCSRSRSSSISSFADLWNSSVVEIRDGSSQRGVFNPTTALLQSCKRQVILPYFVLLAMITWRPFGLQSLRCNCMLRVLNVLYPMVVIVVLIFSYASSIIACQARLEAMHPKTTLAPTTLPIPTTKNVSHLNWTSLLSAHHVSPTIDIREMKLKPGWNPAIMECTHIVSAYAVPNFIHFLAFALSFCHYRIQASEGLQGLIEKVFLQSVRQPKIVKTLRSFLIGGLLWLCFSLGNFMLFVSSFGLVSVTGFTRSERGQWMSASLMVLGRLVENCVSIAIVLNYGTQCQLLIYYLKDITLRLEEKTADLNLVMKDVLEVKKNLNRINGIISNITTLVVFLGCELSVIALCVLILERTVTHIDQLVYRSLVPLEWVFLITFPLIQTLLTSASPNHQAARLTSTGFSFKQRCLQTRVYGYPSATQLDLDSFLQFIHSIDLKARLFCMPMKKSYVCGVFTLAAFLLLLMFQTSIAAGSNTWF